MLVAEIVAHFLPKMVEIHNYSSASSQAQKLTNWDTLNSKCQLKLEHMFKYLRNKKHVLHWYSIEF